MRVPPLAPRMGPGALEALLADQAWRALRGSARAGQPGRLLAHGAKVYSQGDEDGLLAEVFRRIGPGGRRFVEVGTGDGTENNTLALLLQGWTGIWVEQDADACARAHARMAEWVAAGDLRILQARVQPGWGAAAGVDWGRLDLLSLDIDGNDAHVLPGILAAGRPRVLALEYNARFAPPIDWVMPHDADWQWDGTDRFGASLAAWCRILGGHYALVGCSGTGVNAFFVRSDQDLSGFCAPFDAANHYEPARYHLIPGLPGGHPPAARLARPSR